jgi:hypothetical protein
VFFDAMEYEWIYEKEGYQLKGYKKTAQEFVDRHLLPDCTPDETELMWDVAERLVDLAAQDLYYLPDFWLPTHKVWAEVKPPNDRGMPKMSLEEIEKIFRLVNRTNFPCWVCTDFGSDIFLIEPANPVNNFSLLRRISPNLHDTKMNKAIYAARGARFEHGETPL